MEDFEAHKREIDLLDYIADFGQMTFSDLMLRVSAHDEDELREILAWLQSREMIRRENGKDGDEFIFVTDKGDQITRKRSADFAAKCEAMESEKREERRRRWGEFWRRFGVFRSR